MTAQAAIEHGIDTLTGVCFTNNKPAVRLLKSLAESGNFLLTTEEQLEGDCLTTFELKLGGKKCVPLEDLPIGEDDVAVLVAAAAGKIK